MLELMVRLTRRPADSAHSRSAQALRRRGYRDGERQPAVPHHWANR